MGRIFLVDLEGRAFLCKICRTQLAHADGHLSKAFRSRRGIAYFIDKVVNVFIGTHEEGFVLTAMHTMTDIYCCCCGQKVCWKYLAAHDSSQKYKEGKFVLERARIIDNLDLPFHIFTRAT